MERDVWGVGGALAVTLRVSRVFGAAPLRLRANGSMLIARVSSVYALYGIGLIATLNVMVTTGFLVEVTHNMGNIRRMIGGGTNTDFLMWVMNTVITHFYVTIGVCSAQGRMTRMIHHFSLINKANFEGRRNNEKLKREAKRTTICILILTMMFAFVTIDFAHSVGTAVLLKKELIAAYLYGAYYLCYFIGIVLEVQIILILYGIHASMESLNEELKRILSNIQETRPLSKDEENSLRRITVQYNSISDFVNHINNHDGGLMLLMFASLNMYLLFTAYSLHNIVLEFAGDQLQLFNIIRQATWCTIHGTAMMFLMEPCHQTQKEEKKLRVLLSDVMERTQPVGRSNVLCTDVLYKQVIFDTPTFSPLGVCTFSRSLFTTAISGLTTCLVFVVQYRWNNINENTI